MSETKKITILVICNLAIMTAAKTLAAQVPCLEPTAAIIMCLSPAATILAMTFTR